MIIFVIILIVAVIGLFLWGYITSQKLSETSAKASQLNDNLQALNGQYQQIKTIAENLQKQAGHYKQQAESLVKYTPILEIDQAIIARQQQKMAMEAEIVEAQRQRDAEIEKGKEDGATLRRQGQEASEEIIKQAKLQASLIEKEAHDKAKEFSEEIYQAHMNQEKLRKEYNAIKNRIDGYGDEHLVPSQSILDELADQWEHKDAGMQLKKVRKQVKDMVKNGMLQLMV